MCPVSSQRLALVLCIALNAINVNSAATNTWTAITAEQIAAGQQQQPQRQERLKAFQDGESFQVGDGINVSAEDNEQPLLPYKAAAAEDKTVLKTLIGGVYHNYRSSYVGNKSGSRIMNRNRLDAVAEVDNKIDEEAMAPAAKPSSDFDNEIRYNVGPGVNISVDKTQELVSVFLDEDCLKDVFTGTFCPLFDSHT